MTCPSKTTRQIVSWLVAQTHELGIHQDQSVVAHAYGPADRADLMLIEVLYAHYWITALTGQAPLIRPADFEVTTVRSRPVMGDTDRAMPLVPRRSLTELLVFNTRLLLNLHDPRTQAMSLEYVLETEERWENWCQAWIAEGRTTGSQWTDPFLDTLWDWGRITLRAPTIGDKRFTSSSLSVLSRSAVKILASIHYMYAYESDDVNMVWQHLKIVVACAHIVLFSFWRYELREDEAARALDLSLEVLMAMQPRWGLQIEDAVHNIHVMADVVGIHLPPVHAQRPEDYPDIVEAGQPVDEITPIGKVPDNHMAQTLGMLYEAFPEFSDDMGWTIDPLFFGQTEL